MSGSPLRTEVAALRQELSAVRLLLERLEVRLRDLEAEAEFESVAWPGTEEGRQAPPQLSFWATSSGASAPSATPGSGGVNLSPAVRSSPPRPSAGPGSGGAGLSRASAYSTSPGSRASPGSGGVDLSRAPALSSEDGSSETNPGPPSSAFRVSVAKQVGGFLRRALDGLPRGTSGRDRLSLQSKYYVVLADFEGRRPSEPLICTAFDRVRRHCHRGPQRGASVFVGLPSQAEVGVALTEAGLVWPSGGLNGDPEWV